MKQCKLKITTDRNKKHWIRIVAVWEGFSLLSDLFGLKRYTLIIHENRHGQIYEHTAKIWVSK